MDQMEPIESEAINIHRSPTIGPIAKLVFFISFCLTVGAVLYRVSGSMLEKTFPGRVVTYEIEVSPKVGGKIIRMEVEKNSQVAKGQVLAELVDETLEARFEAIEAELTKLRDTIEREKSDPTLLSKQFDLEQKRKETETLLAGLRLEVEQIERRIRFAEEAFDRADEKLNRANLLLEKKALTRSQHESYAVEVAAASNALADLVAERLDRLMQIDSVEDRTTLFDRRREELLEESNQRLVELELEIRKKEGELQTLLADKNALVVTSDHSGIVTRDPRSVGEIVPGGTPILYLSTGERMWVEAALPPNEADALKEGDQVLIVPERSHTLRLMGTVTGTLPILQTELPTSMSPFDSQNVVAVVMIDFNQPDDAKQKLRSGQRVTVKRSRDGESLP